MKKRSLLALAMVGALSVSMLAGCGSSSTKETQAPAGSEVATEAATEAAKESTAAGDGKVYYLNSGRNWLSCTQKRLVFL